MIGVNMIKLSSFFRGTLCVRGLSITSFLVLIVLAAVFPLKAQTCSCAGAPLISSQSLGIPEKGNLVLGLTGNYNNIDKLYSGAEELNNRTSERSTFTSLLEINYGLTERISFTGAFTYVTKERVTGLQTQSGAQTLQTSGIGDAVLLLKYSLIKQTLWKPYQFVIGGGGKAPLGSNSLRSQGLSLNADMQPGTGSWDGIGWMLFSYTLRSKNIHFFTMNSYKINGSAERFGSNDNYRFGDELNVIAGSQGPAFNKFSYGLKLKYRSSKQDLRNGSFMPSTGGKWLNAELGVTFQLSDRFSLQAAGEIPLYRDVVGTQPTTSYIVNTSLFFSLKKLKSGFNFGKPINN